MKIAICIDKCSLGGVGTSTYILCKGMRDAGHEANILATNYEIGDDYLRSQSDGWPIEAICVAKRWLRKRLSITLEKLSNYDVVINNHSIETQLVLPALPSAIIRLSVIRSTDNSVISGALLNSSSLDALVGISPQVADLLKEAENSCPVRMIPNAVLLKNDAFPLLSNPLRMAFVGRLSEQEKNILILPEIANVLANRHLQFQLTVVGDGPQHSDLEDKIRQFGFGNFFQILGSLDREQAWNVLRQSHFAIIPSNYEGFGLVLGEAMAAGCVPITSDIPVFCWILGEYAPLLTVPVKNAELYADRLCAIAANPEKYILLQQGLRHRQRQHFTPEVTVEKYLRLISHLRETRRKADFLPVPLGKISLPGYYRRRYSRFWKALQILSQLYPAFANKPVIIEKLSLFIEKLIHITFKQSRRMT